MRRPSRTIGALACALAITLAACGDDDDAETTEPSAATDATDSATTEPADTAPTETDPATTEPPATDPPATEAPTTEPPATDAPTTTEAAPELGSIIDVLTADGRFTTLLTAIDAAGLTDQVASREVTLLAPTDDAFAALGQPAIDALLADPVALGSVLQGHVLPVPQDAEAIAIFNNVLAINGASWLVVVDGETLMIGPATVIEADLAADNGVIHVIDTVLVPEAAPAG